MSEEEFLNVLTTLDDWLTTAIRNVHEDKMLEAGVLFGKAHNKVQSVASFLRKKKAEERK